MKIERKERMAKNQTIFVCSNCGNESPKWLGKCPACNSWNTFYEEKIVKDKATNERKATSSMVMKLNSVETQNYHRFETGFEELDRVLRWWISARFTRIIRW